MAHGLGRFAVGGCVDRHFVAQAPGRRRSRLDGRRVVAHDDVLHAAATQRGPRAGDGGRRVARPRGDHGQIAADHVGEHERHETAGAAGPREAAPLHEAQFAAGRVERGDVGPGLGERTGAGDLLRERHAVARRRDERRPAAGDHRDDEIAGPERADEREHLARGLHDSGCGQIRPRGPRLAHLDPPERTAAPLRHAHEPAHVVPFEQGGAEHRFDPGCHACGSLAAADHDHALRRSDGIAQRWSAASHEPFGGDSPKRRRPDRLGIAPQIRHHSPAAGGKFLGSNRERSMPPFASSSRSFTRISSRSSRRASRAGLSSEGVTGCGRGTSG